MKHDTVEAPSFAALFLSLCMILFYLAFALEAARGAGDFWLDPPRAASFVAGQAMRGLLLSALMGLGWDWCMKKTQMYTKN